MGFYDYFRRKTPGWGWHGWESGWPQAFFSAGAPQQAQKIAGNSSWGANGWSCSKAIRHNHCADKATCLRGDFLDVKRVKSDGGAGELSARGIGRPTLSTPLIDIIIWINICVCVRGTICFFLVSLDRQKRKKYHVATNFRFFLHCILGFVLCQQNKIWPWLQQIILTFIIQSRHNIIIYYMMCRTILIQSLYLHLSKSIRRRGSDEPCRWDQLSSTH